MLPHYFDISNHFIQWIYKDEDNLMYEGEPIYQKEENPAALKINKKSMGEIQNRKIGLIKNTENSDEISSVNDSTKILPYTQNKRNRQTKDRIFIDAYLYCALCQSQHPLHPALLIPHIESYTHQVNLLCQYQRLGSPLSNPLACTLNTTVYINNQLMSFDNSIVFPKFLFGEGVILYDITVKALRLPDACGGVYLYTGHSYLLIALVIAPPNVEFIGTEQLYFGQYHQNQKQAFFDLRTHYYRNKPSTPQNILKSICKKH